MNKWCYDMNMYWFVIYTILYLIICVIYLQLSWLPCSLGLACCLTCHSFTHSASQSVDQRQAHSVTHSLTYSVSHFLTQSATPSVTQSARQGKPYMLVCNVYVKLMLCYIIYIYTHILTLHMHVQLYYRSLDLPRAHPHWPDLSLSGLPCSTLECGCALAT